MNAFVVGFCKSASVKIVNKELNYEKIYSNKNSKNRNDVPKNKK